MALILPYEVAVGPAGSGPAQELTLFDSWTLNRNLDDGCTLSFSCPGDVPEAFFVDELANDVWLYRSGVLDQRFRITATNVAWDADGEVELSVQAVCYRRILASRHLNTDLSFVQVSQGDIVWDLIQHTQALPGGDLGITVGDLGPTVLRDREYVAGSNILELIVDLSDVEDGLAWDVDENLRLFVTVPNLYPIRSQPIILGANANELSRPSSAQRFGNVILVTGNTQATSLVVEEDANVGVDPRGRWERKLAVSQESDQNVLQETALGFLDESRSPVSTWSVEMEPERFFTDSEFGLGDFVKVAVPDRAYAGGPPAGIADVQVVATAVTVNADGEIEVRLAAVEAVHPLLPSVETFAVTDITTSSATLNGEVTAEGDYPVTARGFVYGPNPAPVLGGGGVVQVPSGSGSGVFDEAISGLPNGTTFYVRAYAVSVLGTSYGQTVSFATVAIVAPTVTTTAASNVAASSATLGGNVTADGNATVTESGVVYSLSPNPQIGGAGVTKVAIGSGLGSFSQSVTGLSSGVLYYFRAYATNSAGDGYGAVLTFTTLRAYDQSDVLYDEATVTYNGA